MGAVSAPKAPRTLRVPDTVARLIRGMHPELRSKVKAALQTIRDDPHSSGKPLKEQLAGLRSYRAARFRIIYRTAGTRTIEIIALGPRKSIYEETFRILQRDR